MGQLTALKIKTVTIPTPGGDLAVRGLSFEDLWIIAQEHGPAATMLFSRIANKEKFSTADINTIFYDLIPQAPNLIGAAIALAVDEYTPEAIAMAKKLPPMAQFEVVKAIFELTIQSEAELKKFAESIIRMLSGAKGLVEQMRLPPSEAGFGDSVVA